MPHIVEGLAKATVGAQVQIEINAGAIRVEAEPERPNQPDGDWQLTVYT